jgi:selenide,water dikinase
MASGSGVSLVLDSAALPVLPDALSLAGEGSVTGGSKRNRAYLDPNVAIRSSVGRNLVEIAFDPQTSGGLLIALPHEEAAGLVAALHARGVAHACVVGEAVRQEDVAIRLV